MRFLHQSEQLCQAQPFKANNHQQSLFVQLKRLSYLVQTGCQIHLISDFSQLDDNCRKLLSQMRRHNQLNGWQINDPLEQQLPEHVQHTKLQINSLYGSGFFKKNNALQQYQSTADERQQKIATTFIKLGVPLYQLSAASPLMEQFHVPAR